MSQLHSGRSIFFIVLFECPTISLNLFCDVALFRRRISALGSFLHRTILLFGAGPLSPSSLASASASAASSGPIWPSGHLSHLQDRARKVAFFSSSVQMPLLLDMWMVLHSALPPQEARLNLDLFGLFKDPRSPPSPTKAFADEKWALEGEGTGE